MCLQVFDTSVWDHINVSWHQIEMRYNMTLQNLGPYAASLFLHAELQQHISRINLEYPDNTRVEEYDIDIPTKVASKPPLPQAFWEIHDIHAGFSDFFPDLSSPDYTPVPVPMTWCTPKVQTLVELLLAYHTSTFQGIVFVEQRQVAACLTSILPALPELKGIIRTACLVGQGVGIDGLAKSTPGARSDAITLFRKREVNLRTLPLRVIISFPTFSIVIATSVAEEGLDFPVRP